MLRQILPLLIAFHLPAATPKANVATPNLPLYFEANTGQFAPKFRFASPVLAIAPAEAHFSTGSDSPTIRMAVEGGNPDAAVAGLSRVPGESNYLAGNDPSLWRTHVPHYSAVRSKNVYPGIDLIYYSKARQFEFDFVVAPGADPASIRLRFENTAPRLNTAGDLLLHATGGSVTLHKPVAYQEKNGIRSTVSARFRVAADGRVSFVIGAYDQTLPLIIDPLLSFSTLMTANHASAFGIAVDTQGNAYMAGYSVSSFLTVGALIPNSPGGAVAFVSKFNSTGTELIYSTFLCGTVAPANTKLATYAYSIAVDRTGNAYVVGQTNSTNFPVISPAIQSTNRGGDDVFVAKLNPTGSALVYSTYLGGSKNDNSDFSLPSVAVDESGSAYVAGATASTDFPTTPGALQTKFGGGNWDSFVSKINPSGSSLVYSTYVGAESSEGTFGLAIDSDGSAYLAGATDAGRFLTTPGALQTAYGGGGTDAFVSKVSPTGAALVYSTLLGGNADDIAFGIALDRQGTVVVAGHTKSTNFPLSSRALQTRIAQGDGFVARLNATGSQLIYSTLIGGANPDHIFSVKVDANGSPIVCGRTESSDFPTTADAFQRGPGLLKNQGGAIGTSSFLAKLANDGTSLIYATYLAGGGYGSADSVALDSRGNAYLAGETTSVSFPRTTGANEPASRGDFHSSPYLAKIDFTASGTPTLGSIVSAANYQAGQSGVVAPGQIVALFGQGIGPNQLTTLQLNADGRVATSLAGVRVLFDGTPAPILYVSANQHSVVVPYGVVPNGSTVVRVEFGGQLSNPLVLWVSPSIPAIFTQDSSGRGQGSILNQDGSVNTPANAAATGSIVVVYGTGEGPTLPAGIDGKVTADTLPRPIAEISAEIDGRAAQVLYAGSAPGLVAGVLQMNLRIPDGVRPGPNVPLRISARNGESLEVSEQVTLAIR